MSLLDLQVLFNYPLIYALHIELIVDSIVRHRSKVEGALE